MRWEDIPFDPTAAPEVKAREFDRQFSENCENANDKRDRGEYPYGADSAIE